MENIHRDLFKERGEERKSKSRDVSNRSLKTVRETEQKTCTLISQMRERERGRKEKSKSRDLSNRSLKRDREPDSREPTWMSLERERGEERKRLRAEI